MPGLSDLVPEGHRVVPTSNVAELAQNAVQNALELGLPWRFQGRLVPRFLIHGNGIFTYRWIFIDFYSRYNRLRGLTIIRWWFEAFFIFTPTWGDDPS